jgi:acyl-CoA synthetase (NDP forming)
VLRAAGLDVVATCVADDVAGAAAAADEVGYPVAVKVQGRHRLAKSEVGGVALDVHDEPELRATIDRMGRALGDGAWPVVVQPMADPGVDVAVSVADHPLVGPVLTLGPGGVATPVAAVEVQVLPLTDRDAERLVARSALAELLDDRARATLQDLVLRVGALVEEAPEVVALELNPVLVSGDRAAVADARLRVAPVERDPLPPVRRL